MSLFLCFLPVCPHTQARAHCRVAVAALTTLAGYIDWVSLVHITSGNCHLLEMLCLLLGEPELQLEASECLLIALSRKVNLKGKCDFDLTELTVALLWFVSDGLSSQTPDKKNIIFYHWSALKCTTSDGNWLH